MTIYIDVLFAVNGIVNFMLLLATSKISKIHTHTWRLFVGAFFGAIYAVCMFFPQVEALYTLISKIIISFIIIAVTFTIKKLRHFLKTVFIFYITSFIFGGIALGLFYFIGFGKGTVISNGIFYFNLPWRILAIASITAYGIIRFVWKVAKSDRMRDYKRIDVYLKGNKASLNALVDTGNMLSDPVSKMPVIVAEFDVVAPILPQSFISLYKSLSCSPENIILENQDSFLASRLRIIPYSSLGTTDGMLIGMKPDSVKIGKLFYDDIIIGIYSSKLSKNMDYNALLNPEIISVI